MMELMDANLYPPRFDLEEGFSPSATYWVKEPVTDTVSDEDTVTQAAPNMPA